MTQQFDTLVLGGGIIGLSIAWELARRQRRVMLLEAKECARAASWAGVGILPPVAERNIDDPLEQLRSLSHGLLAQWSVELQQLTGIDPGYRRCGGIYLATTAGEAATLAANQAYWDELGIQVQRLTEHQLVADEPGLSQLVHSGRLKSGLYLSGECQLRTPHYTQALVQACRQAGVEIVCGTTVQQLRIDRGRVVEVIASQASATLAFQAQNYCLAAGAWTGGLLQGLGISNGILPIRGQVMLLRPAHPLLRRIINEGHRYLVPRDDGRILLGSNEEEAGFVCETTPEVLNELFSWAVSIVPELRNAEIEKSWAGLRPGSYDSYPYLGKATNLDNLYIAAGHFRAGIHLSAGTARVLADLITGGSSTIDLACFRPTRG